jgi:hypothetical protein
MDSCRVQAANGTTDATEKRTSLAVGAAEADLQSASGMVHRLRGPTGFRDKRDSRVCRRQTPQSIRRGLRRRQQSPLCAPRGLGPPPSSSSSSSSFSSLEIEATLPISTLPSHDESSTGRIGFVHAKNRILGRPRLNPQRDRSMPWMGHGKPSSVTTPSFPSMGSSNYRRRCAEKAARLAAAADRWRSTGSVELGRSLCSDRALSPSSLPRDRKNDQLRDPWGSSIELARARGSRQPTARLGQSSHLSRSRCRHGAFILRKVMKDESLRSIFEFNIG